MDPLEIREIVRGVLYAPHEREWSLQGLGMFRTYLTDELRLQVWDEEEADPAASRLHNHPWSFESVILAGEMTNCRFVEDDSGEEHQRVRIFCGPEGHTLGDVERAPLLALPEERLLQGGRYAMDATEVHDTQTLRGTVSLIQRTFRSDRTTATVYWREGPWGSAGAVTASPEQVTRITRLALDRWF